MEEKKLNKVEIELIKINGMAIFVGKIMASVVVYGITFVCTQTYSSNEIFSSSFLSLLCLSPLFIVPAIWSNMHMEIKALS